MKPPVEKRPMAARILPLLVLFVLSLVATSSGQGQSQVLSESPQGSYAEFVSEFRRMRDLSEEQADEFFSRYTDLLTPGSDVTQLSRSLRGREPAMYPLAPLKEEEFYEETIARLVESKNLYERIVGYAILAAAEDSSHNEKLRAALKSEEERTERLWAGSALLHLKDEHSSEIFDFLVKDEDFSDPHLLAMYFELDPILLQQTACEKIGSTDPRARILAVQSLVPAGLNPQTDRLVREAVASWDLPPRGYAIHTMGRLGMGELRELLEPSLSDKKLRRVALSALANSPTASDQDYLATLVESPEYFEDVLDAYFESGRPEAVRIWLDLLAQEDLPNDYVFFTFKQPLLQSDELHLDVLTALEEIQNPKMLASLVRALDGRRDQKSVQMLIGFLDHADSSLRYWAAEALKEVQSPLLVERLPALLGDPDLRTSALTALAIGNGLDNLQDIYSPLLQSEEREWRRSAVEYLAAFPRKTEVEALRTILRRDEDSFTKRDAALALAQVGEEKDVDLILSAMREEPPVDSNVATYLVALGFLKGDQARAILESYRSSPDPRIGTLVETLLNNW